MPNIAAKYTRAQREAAAIAIAERDISPKRCAELARAGELKDVSGDPVAPFDPPEATLRTWALRHRKTAAGLLKTPLETMPPRDAIENLRVRCVNSASRILGAYERQVARKPHTADPERLRQIIRVVREAAALPGPNEERPASPGRMKNGQTNGGLTRDGIAGRILADMRAGETAPDHPKRHDNDEDTTEASAAASSVPRIDGSLEGDRGAAQGLLA